MTIARPKQTWIIGPWSDLGVFILTPLLIVPAWEWVLAGASFAALKVLILSVSSTGHHLPGFIRAYTDKAIFARFRARLLIVPALFLALAAAAAWFRLSLVFFILIAWSTWHGAMQVLGFLRIYDAKAGYHSAWMARLDWWLCLCWFAQVVLWSSPKLASLLGSFYLAGGPLIPEAAFGAASRAWLALTAAVTVAWAAFTAQAWLRGGYLNPAKLACAVSSIGFWAYCMIGVNNLVLGLMLWEVFHDLQYNAFVWDYNRRRVERGLSASPLERFLFVRDWRRLAVYAVCIAAYGCAGLLNPDLAIGHGTDPYASALARFGNVFAASALIHFWLDGFIWKVRDAKVRADLGLAAAPVPAAARPEWRHWAWLGIFFAACAALGTAEWRERAAERAREDNLAELVPASGYANFMRAARHKAAGRPDSALLYYERAAAADTAYAMASAFIGELKFQAGDWPGAAAAYGEALRREPGDPVLRDNLAEAEYRWGFSLLQAKRGLEARPRLEASLALRPDRSEAWDWLGMIAQATGDRALAEAHYRRAVALDPANASAAAHLRALETPVPP